MHTFQQYERDMTNTNTIENQKCRSTLPSNCS